MAWPRFLIGERVHIFHTNSSVIITPDFLSMYVAPRTFWAEFLALWGSSMSFLLLCHVNIFTEAHTALALSGTTYTVNACGAKTSNSYIQYRTSTVTETWQDLRKESPSRVVSYINVSTRTTAPGVISMLCWRLARIYTCGCRATLESIKNQVSKRKYCHRSLRVHRQSSGPPRIYQPQH